jgi:methionyl-tRNA formyltransferase
VRVVFMGTPEFAVPSLDALAREHDVCLVFTREDAASGRGSRVRPSPVKMRAEALGIDVLELATLRGAATDRLAAEHPDVVCVAAFGMLLPPEALAVPPHGCINVHASLLPRHRGAAPVQRAVLEGDAVTGVSIMRMEEGLDTGPYALQRTVPVGERYATEIEEHIATVGADALLETLALIESGTVNWTAQNPGEETYAAKISKDDVALLPELPVTDAYRRVRAATPSAPARACLGDREVTVIRAHPVSTYSAPGAVCVSEGAPILGFADGSLALDVVRPAGKGDMSGTDWARGARMAEDACWRCTR